MHVFKMWRVLYFARAIMNLINCIILMDLQALLRVFCQSRVFLPFFGKHQIVAQSLNSPKFENMLPGNNL